MASHPDSNIAGADPDVDTVDTLLERYLLLLDEYARLRTSLSALQAGVHRDLARANFAAERGAPRYGEACFDGRMRALRRLRVSFSSSSTLPEGEGVDSFEVETMVSEKKEEKREVVDEEKEADETKEEKEEEEETSAPSTPKPDEKGKDSAEAASPPPNPPSPAPKPTDPLRWFGILTPMPLRTAQSQAVRAVEEVIPRLASVSAEMAALEIAVRRARKRRAKRADAVAAEEEKQRSSAVESTSHEITA